MVRQDMFVPTKRCFHHSGVCVLLVILLLWFNQNFIVYKSSTLTHVEDPSFETMDTISNTVVMSETESKERIPITSATPPAETTEYSRYTSTAESTTAPYIKEAISEHENLKLNLNMTVTYKMGITEYTPTTEVIPKAETTERIHNKSKRKNVLFIVADDLRPQLNSYQGTYSPNPYSSFHVHTPNLDALAKRSIQFMRAYAQYSVCGPSRSSFLTSRRPDTTKVWNLSTYWRTAAGNFTTIPQFYKNNGYDTIGLGKIFHKGPMSNGDDPISWSEPNYHGLYYSDYMKKVTWEAVPMSERKDKPLPDEDVTQVALKTLQGFAEKAKTSDQPFFLAVGYHKPHLPYICPEESFDLYPLEVIEKVNNSYLPHDFPPIHWFPPITGKYNDMSEYHCSPTEFTDMCQLPPEAVKLERRAYFACTSYIDDLVGKLVQEVTDLNLTESTIISFISDHGFHLGENGMVGKHTNMEQSTRVPFFLSIPGRTDHGIVSDSLVELVDLLPTLSEASGLGSIRHCPQYSGDIELCTDGTSLMTLIDNPKDQVKEAAVSQMTRKGSMGYSIRTDNYRYNAWTRRSVDSIDCQAVWKDLIGVELYDHQVDPEENWNLAGNSSYSSIVSNLQQVLQRNVPIEKSKQTGHWTCS